MDEATLAQGIKVKHGVSHLKKEWLGQEIARLRSRNVHLSNYVGDTYASFLSSDIQFTSDPSLPNGVCDKDNEELHDVVVQLEEPVDISAPLTSRYQIDGANRTLKLSLTDGHQRIYGIESVRLTSITMASPAGLKVRNDA